MDSRAFVVGGAAALAVAVLAPPSSADGFSVKIFGYDNINVTVTGGLFTNANGYRGFEYARGWVANNAAIALFPETYELGTWHALHSGEYVGGTPVTADATDGLLDGTVSDPGTPFPILGFGPGGTGGLAFGAFPGTRDTIPAAPMAFPELGRSGLGIFLGRYTITGGSISGVIGVGIPTPEDFFSVFYFDVDSTALAPVFSDNGSDLGLYLRPRPGFENSFDIYLTDVPAPGAAALLGVVGLGAPRRRR